MNHAIIHSVNETFKRCPPVSRSDPTNNSGTSSTYQIIQQSSKYLSEPYPPLAPLYPRRKFSVFALLINIGALVFERV